MSRDSDVTLYVEFNNVNKFTYNVTSLSRDITDVIDGHNYFKNHCNLINICRRLFSSYINYVNTYSYIFNSKFKINI